MEVKFMFGKFSLLLETKGKTTVKSQNEAAMLTENSKLFADKFAESLNRMRNETDPIKQSKMNMRLALGVTDFSDL